MTNEQLAIFLTNYHLDLKLICGCLDRGETNRAVHLAHETEARLNAVLKTLNIEVYISPLG